MNRPRASDPEARIIRDFIARNPGLACYEIADATGFERSVTAGLISKLLIEGDIKAERNELKRNSEGRRFPTRVYHV